MRFWDVSGPEVEAADAQPWDMPLASVFRPFSTKSIVRLLLGASILYSSTGVTGLALYFASDPAGAHRDSWFAFQLWAIWLGVLTFGVALLVPPRLLRRTTPVLAFVLLAVTPLTVSWGIASSGPGQAIIALGYIQTPIFAFYMMKRPWAIAQSVLVVVGFGLVVAVQDGWVAPAATWGSLVANVVGTGVVIGYVAARADHLAAAEHEARVELAELNHTLEDRVESQVAEIEHLGGLRRFLSTQVADIVLAGDNPELTTPHRARIAVFFCDLRGFTAFTNNAEPEEVVGVLDEYYGAVGGLLQQYDATVGDYAGDGIMAYFGDPVPREDAAQAAVAMTRDVARVMVDVIAEWRRRGYDLDFGVGLAHGYATLGVIGFDGRYDYKPIGGVVNLAARLCGKAGASQALMDHATYAATSEQFASTPVEPLQLKGYAGETRAYALG